MNHGYWSKQMEAAEKRLRKYVKQGNSVVDTYLDDRDNPQLVAGDKSKTFKINLFHTNIQTLESMLYGQTPKIDVSREFNDPTDDVARVAALLVQRFLEADADISGGNCATVLKAALQDRLLPGMGIARVKYEFDSEPVPTTDPNTLEVTEVQQVTAERAPAVYVHWRDVRWGWGRTFSEVPWWAFRAYMTKDAVEKRFGPDVAKALEYSEQVPGGDKSENRDKDEQSVTQKAQVWEIWCKKTKKVYWWSPGYGQLLDERDDPLRLNSFFPIPQPMMANLTTKMFVPKADFVIDQDLYHQINELATRINIITDAVKVVGVYDGSAGASVGRMLKEGMENDLIPVDNWAMFAEAGGLKGKIDYFPVETIVGVLQTLRQVLNDTIQQLYEVTGLSDIMRGGNTDQYTANGTQQLKAKMGSIRVQRLQDDFARFASDLEALRAEVMAKHFTPQQIALQTSARYLPESDLDKVPDAVALIQSGDAKWRINIRPESIAMVDYAQLKQERIEFLTAMATYVQSAQAMAKAEPGSLPVLMEMLKWGMSGFKGANYLEGIMDRAIDQVMQAQQQPQQNQQPQPEQLRLEAEKEKTKQLQMKIAGDIQKITAKAQADMANIQAKLQAEIQTIGADAQRDSSLEAQRLNGQLEQISRELQASLAEIASQLNADLAVEGAQAGYDMEINDQEHQHAMTQISAASRVQ